MTVEQVAAASGVDRLEALQALSEAVRAGTVVKIVCGERQLYSRLGGGRIIEARS